MNKGFLYLIALIALSCNEIQPQDLVGAIPVTSDTALEVNTKADTTKSAETNVIDIQNLYQDEVATFYIVIADTSSDYYTLHNKMKAAEAALNIPIDTLGRGYNQSKNLIALPEDDEDEMYAGDYFPRRFPSSSLSLEYLDLYQSKAGEKTIVLVAGIYEKQLSADSALVVLRQFNQKAFIVKADMYIGCMH